MNMMVAREVPTAMCMRMAGSTPCTARAVSSTGTMMMPPPTPSSPASTPATAPVASMVNIRGIRPSMEILRKAWPAEYTAPCPAGHPNTLLPAGNYSTCSRSNCGIMESSTGAIWIRRRIQNLLVHAVMTANHVNPKL